MMNYEIFKEVFKGKLTDYMPDEFKNYKAVEHKVYKVNCEKDAINLFPTGENSRAGGSPTIYVENYYEMYKKGESLDDVIRHAADTIKRGYECVPEIIKGDEIDMERLKEGVVAILVNTVQNEDYLKEIPHREFLDLSIIYKSVVSIDKEGMGTAVITNEMASRMEMSEAQLYETAMENTPKLLPATIKPMEEIICEIIMGEAMAVGQEMSMDGTMEMLNEAKGDDELSMYVMTNREKINGAAENLFPENLDKLSAKFNSDIYIIPSSVHEIIAVSAEGKDASELQEMVNEVNMNEVSLEERLSNEVYHYDRDKKELTIASDAPNKRLDGKSESEQFRYDTLERTL